MVNFLNMLINIYKSNLETIYLYFTFSSVSLLEMNDDHDLKERDRSTLATKCQNLIYVISHIHVRRI